MTLSHQDHNFMDRFEKIMQICFQRILSHSYQDYSAISMGFCHNLPFLMASIISCWGSTIHNDGSCLTQSLEKIAQLYIYCGLLDDTLNNCRSQIIFVSGKAFYLSWFQTNLSRGSHRWTTITGK